MFQRLQLQVFAILFGCLVGLPALGDEDLFEPLFWSRSWDKVIEDPDWSVEVDGSKINYLCVTCENLLAAQIEAFPNYGADYPGGPEALYLANRKEFCFDLLASHGGSCVETRARRLRISIPGFVSEHRVEGVQVHEMVAFFHVYRKGPFKMKGSVYVPIGGSFPRDVVGMIDDHIARMSALY